MRAAAVKLAVVVAFTVALAVALGAAMVACFGVGAFPDGTIHCSTDPSRLCPTGSACIGGLCWHTAPDGGIADLPSADAGD